MTLIGETMAGKIVEVGERPDGGFEFVVQVEDGDDLLHVPCTAPVAREAGAALYVPMHITFTMIARPTPTETAATAKKE